MWESDDISPSELKNLRSAAELAWGDDTRNEKYIGHPQPSAGQCYVTSHWLTSKLGGHVGTKDGHFFWVSPDKSHVIDLTGDQFAYSPADLRFHGIPLDQEDEPWEPTPDQKRHRPGPIMYKRSNHPLYKDFRIVDTGEKIMNDDPITGAGERLDQFYDRANDAYNNSRVAEDMGAGDAYPGEEPQYIENQNQVKHLYHDGPDNLDEGEYNWFYGNGQLHVSPHHGHEDLASHAGVDLDQGGPIATGTVEVDKGHALWHVGTNPTTFTLSLNALYKQLKDYSDQVGWKWGGLVGNDGGHLSDQYLSRKAHLRYVWSIKDEHLAISAARFTPREIAKTAGLSYAQTISGEIFIHGKTAFATGIQPQENMTALTEWAKDRGYKLAEYPGGGDMTQRIIPHAPMGEDLELKNVYDPQPKENVGIDRDTPEGVFKCPQCSQKFDDWGQYIVHLKDEETQEGLEPNDEDGKFPELDMDATHPPHYRERQPAVMPLASWKEASRVPGYDLYSKLWRFHEAGNRHYGAYLNGEPVGYGIVNNDGLITMVQAAVPGHGIGTAIIDKMKQHYPELSSGIASKEGERLAQKSGFVNTKDDMWKWAAGQEPKDMIEAEVPFVYDIQQDIIPIGHPGQKHSDIIGQFTPGGIVEGVYEPGGKVVVKTMTNMPWTVRHMVDLWYAEHPQMEVKGVELQDDKGGTTKLAAENVGSYIRTLALADPAAWQAYQELRNAGGKIYVVGGAVRDALMNKAPKDIDLMVTGVPSERVRKALEALPGRVDLTGKDFGVFRYRNKGAEVEVALPRSERSTGDRRVDFDVQVDHSLPVEDDLHRRDFTVNSMAVDMDSGKLVDPYGGARDIENKQLRTVHPRSFEEDPTRLVRALVASSRHGLAPTEQTRKEMEQGAGRLDNESRERIQTELDKLFASNNPAGAIRLAQETGLLKHIFPEVADNFDYDQKNPHHNYPLGDHLLNVLDNTTQKSTDPDLRLAALLHDIGKPASAWTDPQTGVNHYYRGKEGQGADHDLVGAEMATARLRELKYPRARIDRVGRLIQHHMYPDFSSPKGARKFLQRVGDDADDLMTLRWADRYGKGTDDYQDRKTPVDTQRGLVEQVRSAKEPTAQSALSINGNDLIALGVQPGPELGKILRQLTNDVVEDPALNDRDQLLQRAQEYANAIPRAA